MRANRKQLAESRQRDNPNCIYPVDLWFVRCRRIELGYTQEDMANRLGCTKSCYSNKENGKQIFNEKDKKIIAELFNLDARQFNDILYGGMLPY